MKTQTVVFLGIVAVVWVASSRFSEGLADVGAAKTTAQVDHPFQRRCVVTIDPLASSKVEIAGKSNIVTGFSAPDTVEGILIRLDAEWLVLRDGCEENWIPRSKLLMIHVCD